MMEARSVSASPPRISLEIVLAVVIAAAVGGILLRNDLGGLSYDPDSYMHLARFRDGYGIFHGGFVRRDNAPYGTVLPWTMPFDGALGLFYAIGRIFAGPEGALYFAARVVSPIFCASIGPLIFLGLRPFFDLRARVVMGGMAATAPGAIGYSLPGNADHHAMVLWTGVVFAVALIRYLFLPHPRYRHAAIAGLTAAFALWTSIEGFIVVGAGLSALVLYRCLIEEPPDHGTRENDLVFCGAFALAMMAAWLVDPPYEGLWALELDRLSFVYVSFAWLFSATLIGLDTYRLRVGVFSRPRNLAIAAALGGAAFLCWITIDPGVVKGPFAEVDPKLFRIWADYIVEAQPMWQLDEVTGSSAVVFILIWASLAVVIARASGRQRWLWIASAILMVPVSLVGIRYIRASYYTEVLGAIPLGLVLANRTRQYPKVIGYAAIPAMAAVMLGIFNFTALLWHFLAPAAEGHVISQGCSAQSLSSVIAPIRDTDAIVMAEIDQSPMILYLSRHLRTVAGPFHRNREGILDQFAFFNAPSDGEARAILDKRGIEYVLICDTGKEQRSDSFGGRILRDTPAWLQRVGSSSAQTGFRLYRVHSGNERRQGVPAPGSEPGGGPGDREGG